MTKCLIKKILPPPEHWMLYRQRREEAEITKQPLVEKVHHYQHIETGQLYHDLFGCIGWPTEDTVSAKGQPGYVAVVAVVKSERPVKEAWFKLMGEGESEHIPVLLGEMLRLRQQFGYGLHPGLLQTFIGDEGKHVTETALLNEKLISIHGERGAILVSPPNDLGPDAFDTYKRSMDWAIKCTPSRFAPGSNSILRIKHQEYHRDNPAIFAIGGLIHWLLTGTPWMDHARSNVFTIEEG